MNKWFLSLLLLTLMPTTWAEDKPFQTFDDYKVFYSIFNSSFIKPEIARAYNITRGKDYGLVNISVIKTSKSGDSLGLPAIVKGTAANLMQQRKDLKFLEIIEKNAVYYLAQFRFANEEVLNFSIQVAPVPKQKTYELKFTKTLYVDP